jgi:diacylglycerol kinase (ATP)
VSKGVCSPLPCVQHVALFHNPTAGYGPHTAEQLTATLRDAGYRVTYFDLKKSQHDPAAYLTGDFVVVAGGDGSVRKVAMKLAGTGRAMAPIPVGTANNIARSLGLGEEPEKIIRAWEVAAPRELDIGFAIGPWGRQAFIEGFGVGVIPRSSFIIGDIDEASLRDFKTAEDRLHRNRSVIAALAHVMPPERIKLTVERETLDEDFLLLQAMNIDRVGPGLRLAPTADPSDGRLELVLVRTKERHLLQEKLKDSMSGNISPEKFDTRRCCELELTLGPTDLLIDDQVFPLHSPATIKLGVEAGALRVILPKASEPARESS